MSEPASSSRGTGNGRTIAYAGHGRTMGVYEIDLDAAELTKVAEHAFPARIHYGWPNRARTIVYFVLSDSGPWGRSDDPHHMIKAFRILPSGALEPHGPESPLRERPLHLSLDREEKHLLVAYHDPSNVTVHRIEADGTIGAEIPQAPYDYRTTVHQVRVTPFGNIAIVPACAHSADGLAPGALNIMSYGDGKLAPLMRIDPDPARAGPWLGKKYGAHGFAARHVDFHPDKPWMYLCVELQSELHLYDYSRDGVSPRPRFIKSTLDGAELGRSLQLTSGIEVHPNGRFIYVTNRAHEAEEEDGRKVFVGGVNDIAVFAIDQATGEPTLIQHADTHGIFPRTFGIDPTGRILVAGNEQAGWVRKPDGAVERSVPSIAIFRIGDDGTLEFVKRIDLPDNGEVLFWLGVERVPG